MNIVIAIDLIDSPTNGSVMTAKRFAEGLKKRGNNVCIMAVGADKEKGDCPLPVRYVPILSEVSARNQIRFAKYDEAVARNIISRADIVHFIFPFKMEKKVKKLADSMGIPTTAAFHVQPENISFNVHLGWLKPLNDYIYSNYRRKFYKNFNRIHCPSAFIAEQLEAHGFKSELYVISNGYDPSFMPPKAKIPHEKFEIAMVGRLANEKNQKVLISAIAKSKYKGYIHLSLYGHGPMQKKLEKQAKRLGVDMSVDFKTKDELVKCLQQTDLYVHAATVEIEAIACLEAIACGLVPVISDSKMSATKQFAVDSRSIFKENDSNSLAAKIDYWYEHEDERKIMSGIYAGHAKKFSLENSLIMAEKMFQDEIDEHKKTGHTPKRKEPERQEPQRQEKVTNIFPGDDLSLVADEEDMAYVSSYTE